ncbi:MAG: ABC transporter substrate-binding protein [Candidatus Bruticola sp.]
MKKLSSNATTLRWGTVVFFILAFLICATYRISSVRSNWKTQGEAARASLWDEEFSPLGRRRSLRTVSLTPSLTETICNLGAEDLLVGVTDNDDYPPSVKRIPSVGDMYPNFELIAAAAPDLIVYDDRFLPAGAAERLNKMKAERLRLQLDSLDDLAAALPVLGCALGREKEAAVLSEQLATFRSMCSERNKEKTHRPKVFLAIWPAPIMTVGSSSFINDLINMAGGNNCYIDLSASYPTVSIEDLLRRDPDIVIMNCEGAPDLKLLPGWDSLRAVRSGRVHHVPSSLLHRATMRSLQGVELLHRYFEEDYDAKVR